MWRRAFLRCLILERNLTDAPWQISHADDRNKENQAFRSATKFCDQRANANEGGSAYVPAAFSF
jgi:hypothetical protein